MEADAPRKIVVADGIEYGDSIYRKRPGLNTKTLALTVTDVEPGKPRAVKAVDIIAGRMMGY